MSLLLSRLYQHSFNYLYFVSLLVFVQRVDGASTAIVGVE